jgi:hypothetical protein
MKTQNIIMGLQILLAYYNNHGGYHVEAEHDMIFASATDKPLSDASLKAIIALGWHQDHNGTNHNKDFVASDYEADEPWFCYV